MAPVYKAPTSSQAVAEKLSDLVIEATNHLGSKHPEFAYALMIQAIHEHAMISYDLDFMRGTKHNESIPDTQRHTDAVIKHRAEVYAVYQGLAKLWAYILETARALGLREDQDGVGHALFGVIHSMSRCFHSVATNPLIHACGESLRADFELSLLPHIREHHFAVMQGKVFARTKVAHRYLQDPTTTVSLPTPMPIMYLHLGNGSVSLDDFLNGVNVLDLAKEDPEVDRSLKAYRARVVSAMREKRIQNIPVLVEDCWMPMHTFCESNDARCQFEHWVARMLRRHTTPLHPTSSAKGCCRSSRHEIRPVRQVAV